MPFTTFPTGATNDLWTAAQHNTYLRDNINYLIGTAEPALTNKSGGILSAGAVVVPYASADNSFTTTTTAGATVLGVLMENNIADSSSGRVAINGVVTVNVQGNVTRGNYLAASSTAGRAADIGAAQTSGAFAVALTGYAGGAAGTVTAMLIKTTGYGFGLATRVYPPMFLRSDTGASVRSLAAVSAGNAGALAVPIVVPTMMVVDSLSFRAVNGGSTARTAEWRLFRDTGSATLSEVSSVNGTFSYTDAPASGAMNVTSTACNIVVAPGMYWIVLRNTHAANALLVGVDGTDVFSSKESQTNASVAALGSTIDLVTSWTKQAETPVVCLNGRVMGQSSVY